MKSVSWSDEEVMGAFDLAFINKLKRNMLSKFMKNHELVICKEENAFKMKLKYFKDSIIQTYLNLKNNSKINQKYTWSPNILKVKVYTALFSKKIRLNHLNEKLFLLKKIKQEQYLRKLLMQFHTFILKISFIETLNLKIF